MLRKEIIRASYALYNSGMGFEVFRDAKANPDFWVVTKRVVFYSGMMLSLVMLLGFLC